jgi:hypothetical protein
MRFPISFSNPFSSNSGEGSSNPPSVPGRAHFVPIDEQEPMDGVTLHQAARGRRVVRVVPPATARNGPGGVASECDL